MPSFVLFVGDLHYDVRDRELLETFAGASSAQVMTEGGRSKGYGFVRFASEAARSAALRDMAGVKIAGRPVRLSEASSRGGNGGGSGGGGARAEPVAVAASQQQPAVSPHSHSGNRVVAVRGMRLVEAGDVREYYEGYGEVVGVESVGGEWRVRFRLRAEAERAIQFTDGMEVWGGKVEARWASEMPKDHEDVVYEVVGGVEASEPGFAA